MKINSKFNIDNDELDIMVDVKYCKKCKTQNKIKAKFCLECGCNEFVNTLKTKDVKYCAKCHQEVKKSSKFCFECGNDTFVDSLDDNTSMDFEIDSKYKDKYNVVLNKIQKCNDEIDKLNALNSKVEKSIDDNQRKWSIEIDNQLREEKSVLAENEKLESVLDTYKAKLRDIKSEVKGLNDKVKASKKKADQIKEETITLTREKNTLMDKLNHLKRDKEDLEKKIKIQEKAQEEARKREEYARFKAEQEAEKMRQQAILQAKALEAERARLNSPEYKYTDVESKWKGGAFNMVINTLEEIANAGYAKSFILMGIAYEYGYGVTKNLDKAKYWYQKSSQSGDDKGRFKSSNVGVKYYKSTDKSLLTQLAEYQDITAMMTLAKLYQSSNEIGSMSNAALWYGKASARNTKDGGEAAYLAAECTRKTYMGGSAGKAVEYYTEAGYRGHKPSQKILVDAYKNGNPALYLDKDQRKYEFWFEKYKSRW